MNAFAKRTAELMGLLVVALWLNGCSTTPEPKFGLKRYQPVPEKYASLQSSPDKRVYLSPFIARLDPRNEKLLDRKFSVSVYLTDALEQELKSAGLSPQRTGFEVGKELSRAAKVISQRANAQERAVYVAGEVLWFGPVDMFTDATSGHVDKLDTTSDISQTRVAVDVNVYSASGEILFAKRGLCSLVDSVTAGTMTRPRRWLEKPETSQFATQMALRQIVADPAFQKALQ